MTISEVRRCTGPRTEEGKAVSGRNAIRHGLTAKQFLVPGECAEEFNEFSEELIAGLAPVGAVEHMLAERIVLSSWRARRAARFDAAQVAHDVEVARKVALPGQQAIGVALKRLATSDAFSKLARYEAANERSLYRALHELQRLQALRAGQTVPLPMVLDLEGADRE